MSDGAVSLSAPLSGQTVDNGNGCRYRRWPGSLASGRWTWLSIVRAGIRQGMRSKFVQLMIVLSGLMALGGVVVFYVLSLLEVAVGTPQARALQEFVQAFLHVDVRGVERLSEIREPLWRSYFMVMARGQLFSVLFMVTMIGPGLVSRDLRTRALPIYFAKPVTPLTYLTGKWLIVAFFVATVTLFPNLLTLIAGTIVTGGLATWTQTLGLGIDVCAAGMMTCLVSGAIILALSSITSDHRYVATGWLAVCAMLAIAQAILGEALSAEAMRGWPGCLSIGGDVLVVSEWLFGIREAWQGSQLPTGAFQDVLVSPVRVGYAATVLGGWTAAGLFVCFRRIVKFSRAAASV